MDADDIPKECINDPQFVQVLKATLASEYATDETILTDFNRGIKQIKIKLTKELDERKNVKRQIKENKENKDRMEPLLQHLTHSKCKRSTELILLKNKLDDVTLNKKIIHINCDKVLNSYRETWTKYQAEYEEFPYAVIRKQCKIRLEKLKIQLMMKEYKKLNYHNMLKQRHIIDRKRIQSILVISSKMILNRWQQQKYANILNDNINKAQHEYEIAIQKYNSIKNNLDAEAEKNALAKRQMPLPKLNISLVRSLYVDKNLHFQHSNEHNYRYKKKIDFDTMSVNTVMFEEMCQNDENIIYDNDKIIENDNNNELCSAIHQKTDHEIVINDKNNLISHSNIDKIVNRCSQLSVNGKFNNDYNYETVKNKCEQSTIDLHLKSQQSREQLTEEINNPLKHKSPIGKLFHGNDDEQQQKKSKLSELFKDSSSTLPIQLPSTSIIQDNPCEKSQLNIVNPLKNDNSSMVIPTTSESLPQIKKIETVTRPIIIQMKPPMAEVPPTPSSLFSPRHYAPSYASSENLSRYFDNYNDITQDGLSENWQNLSPPQAGSEISFASAAHAPIKNAATSNVPCFVSQPPDKPVSNFLDFFKTSSTNTKSLF